MFQSKYLVAVGMVCVASALPALGQPIDTLWTDAVSNNAEWSMPLNWDFGVPNPTKNALHTMDLSDIEVNIPTAACLSFTGLGGSNADRFMTIVGGKVLTVADSLIGSPGKHFLIRMQDGTLVAPTTLNVAKDVTDIDFINSKKISGDWTKFKIDGSLRDSSVALGNSLMLDVAANVSNTPLTVTHFATINVTGNVSDAPLTVGDFATINIGGNVFDTPLSVGDFATVNVAGTLDSNGSGVFAPQWTIDDNSVVNVVGDVSRINLAAGNRLGGLTGGTTVTVGSIGESAISHERIELFGYAKLFVDDSGPGTGNYLGHSHGGEVFQHRNSEMWVDGITDCALWRLYDDTLFDGIGDITAGQWELNQNARVAAHGDINSGTWELRNISYVEVDGGISAGVSGNSWKLFDNASVTAHGAISAGTWETNDNGSVTVDGQVTDGTWKLYNGALVTTNADVARGS